MCKRNKIHLAVCVLIISIINNNISRKYGFRNEAKSENEEMIKQLSISAISQELQTYVHCIEEVKEKIKIQIENPNEKKTVNECNTNEL